MQAIMETLFDIVYLVGVVGLGIIIIRRSNGEKLLKLFGIMAVVLGCGDSFHLVPRSIALCTVGLENMVPALGFGKLVTSITMTVFYILLYHIWELRYNRQEKRIRTAIYLLAALRIALCFFPQNRWLSPDAPVSWGILRNLPFALMGLIIIVLFFRERAKEGPLGYMWLAVSLSFLFYVPVVLWADAYPLVGILMIPKTCAYFWIVVMGFQLTKQKKTVR